MLGISSHDWYDTMNSLFLKYIFILAALGLSYSSQDLQFFFFFQSSIFVVACGSSVMACELLVAVHCSMWYLVL